MLQFFKDIAREWKQWRCHHFWRPAVLSVNRTPYRPARTCDDCGKMELLTVGRFYAEFGRMPW